MNTPGSVDVFTRLQEGAKKVQADAVFMAKVATEVSKAEVVTDVNVAEAAL